MRKKSKQYLENRWPKLINNVNAKIKESIVYKNTTVL